MYLIPSISPGAAGKVGAGRCPGGGERAGVHQITTGDGAECGEQHPGASSAAAPTPT